MTGAVPQASIDATLPEQYVFAKSREGRHAEVEYSRTPVETVVEAYELCLMDHSMNGMLIECSQDKHFFLPPPEFANGAVTKRACTVWEPLFKTRHHEESGLPGAIP